ncbi:hypothetical protein GY45DRAFT_1316519 [Cubamyces sp. BRFM 1775]|nr:hypothetical protein GY45DRAFT_1316519 [Cubamyces sp. BRFM 1775]
MDRCVVTRPGKEGVDHSLLFWAAKICTAEYYGTHTSDYIHSLSLVVGYQEGHVNSTRGEQISNCRKSSF